MTKTASAERSGTGLVLAGLSLCLLLPSLGTSIANVGLPTMAAAFGASFAAAQWIVLAYLLAVTTLIVGAGRLGDLTGRRRLLLAGTAVFTAGSLGAALAPTLGLLVAARAVAGVGAAAMMALTMAFVAAAVPRARAGAAMGLLGTTSAIGTALGPSLGGVLIAGFGWRAIFLVHVPLGLLTLVVTQRVLPRDGPATPTRLDVAGTLLLALTLGCYALAMTVDGQAVALLVAAAVGAGLFVLVESRVAAPLIPLRVFRDRAHTTGLLSSALVSTVLMTTLVVGPFHLSRALGLGPALVGLVMSVGPVVAALAGVPAGRAADRFGADRMVVVGLTAVLVGAAVLAAAPTALGVAGYVGPLVVTTAGYALFQAANNTTVMATAAAGESGLVSAMLNLSRNLGLVTGASVMGAVFALGAGAVDITTAAPDSVAAGSRAAFAASAALMVVGLALTLARARRPHHLW